tara:strand:- start:1227 stop:2555 length:1329 start_codon:yes stop_codon:yes gene_type:complete
MLNYVKINKSIVPFNKTIKVPGDKSISIRAILFNSQAIGKSKIYNLLESDDVKYTILSMKKLGVSIIKRKDYHEIYGVGLYGFLKKKKIKIYAGNSGTLARLLCGMLSNVNSEIYLSGDQSLSKRDFSRIIEPLKLFGVRFFGNGKTLPLKIKGSSYLRPINYSEIKGSAQVKSAIMLASIRTDGLTTIKAIPSRNHTELMFKNCLKIPLSVKKQRKFEIIRIKGKRNFNTFDYIVPGDISSASFFIILTLLAKKSKLLIKNVNINPSRIGIIEILKKMKVKIILKNKRKYKGENIADIFVQSAKSIKSINCPKKLNTKSIDEFLVIFLLCAKANGISKFNGIDELRHKESDRLKIASNFLKMIGVKVEERLGSLKIYGNPKLKLNGKYHVKNFQKDHRVFMMTCIAALTLGGKFKIDDKNSVNSSFPGFIGILRKLGAEIR